MENGCARAHVQMQPTLTWVKLVSIGPLDTQNLNAILPAVCEIWKRGVHVRTCRCTPPQTCGKHLSDGSLVTHQIWTQSGQPLRSYRGRGCFRHPLPGTCHVPWQAPVGIGTGQIRNLLNGDIEQRRPLVNRSTRSRDISFSKAWWGRVGLGRVGSGRVGSGRAYWDFSLKPQKNSLRASRSARNKSCKYLLHFGIPCSSVEDANTWHRRLATFTWIISRRRRRPGPGNRAIGLSGGFRSLSVITWGAPRNHSDRTGPTGFAGPVAAGCEPWATGGNSPWPTGSQQRSQPTTTRQKKNPPSADQRPDIWRQDAVWPGVLLTHEIQADPRGNEPVLVRRWQCHTTGLARDFRWKHRETSQFRCCGSARWLSSWHGS